MGSPGNAERPRGSARRHSVRELKRSSLVKKKKEKRKDKANVCLFMSSCNRSIFPLVLGKKEEEENSHLKTGSPKFIDGNESKLAV